MIEVEFTRDRNGRLKGERVSYDEVSAEAIIAEGAAFAVSEPEPEGAVADPTEPPAFDTNPDGGTTPPQ